MEQYGSLIYLQPRAASKLDVALQIAIQKRSCK
jgi:hypothetical protein